VSRPPIPLAQLDSRVPEAGRIRLGIKTGNSMKSIDTFRFTSPQHDVIDMLAVAYGGTAKPWRDAKANPPDQFEVITTAKEIDVWLPRGSLSTWYELWSGGGVQRRCTGELCQVPITIPGGWEMNEVPCICDAAKRMECRAYTRLNVILPNLPFRGVWRLETKGWNAAHELPGMVEVIEMMAAQGQMVHAKLGIQKRTQQTVAGKRNFVVPTVSIAHTAQEMLEGSAGVRALSIGAPSATAALSAGPTPALSAASIDDDIIDAEVVSEYTGLLGQYSEQLDALAREHNVNPERLVHGVFQQVGITEYTHAPEEDQLARIRQAISLISAGTIRPIGFNPDGSVIWKRS